MSVLVQTSKSEAAPGISPLFADSAARIRQLLHTDRGERLIKRIFWEVLDYEQVNDLIPPSVLPDDLRDQIAHARIIAQLGGTKVCLIRLLASQLTSAAQLPILQAIDAEWSGSIVVIANLTETDFEIHLLNDGGLRRRIDLHHDEDIADATLHELAQLCASSPEELAPLSEVELQDKLQRLSRRLPIQRRRRRRKQDTPFWREVGHHKLLTHAEEKHLRRSLTPGQRSPARDKLILANLRLVITIAHQHRRRGVEFDDLIQAGCIGLTRAADLFNPDLGCRFSTYAYYWIFQSITRTVYQSHLICTPIHMVELLTRYRRSYRDLLIEHHRRPTDREIAKALRVTATEYHHIRRTFLTSRCWRAPMDTLPQQRESTDPSHHTMLREVHEIIASRARDSNHTREMNVICQRYGLDGKPERTLEEVGHSYRITRERIRQIEAKAQKWLRERGLASHDDKLGPLRAAGFPSQSAQTLHRNNVVLRAGDCWRPIRLDQTSAG